MSSQENPTIDLDSQFALVADSRRCLALEILEGHETPLTVRDLATKIVTQEHDAPFPDVPAEAVTEVYTSLHHHHLPKLADGGVIDYDEVRGHIDEVDLERLEPILPAVTDITPE